MIRRWKLKSNWLAPADPIPEMELSDLVLIFREHFGILSEPVEASIETKPYWVRLIGSPYNAFVEECRSIRVMAHNRGRLVAPIVIKQVLEKFAITEAEFRGAYNIFFARKDEQPSRQQEKLQ